MRAARLLAVLAVVLALPAWATEVLVLNSAAVQVDASKSRRRVAWEIQNLGPNAIYCETQGTAPTLLKSRKVASGESWSGPAGVGDIYCKAASADQVTGAATIYTEAQG